MIRRYLTTLILFCVAYAAIKAQDPFFVESRQVRSFVNPALVGLNGSLSITAAAKNQYFTANPALLSAGISVEQSAPCIGLDFGAHYVYDREGDGFLSSHFIGGNVVYTVPFTLGRSDHNIRFGAKAEGLIKSVEWGNLYFSDQLDPKYGLVDENGNPNQGAFIEPEWSSTGQLNLGLGFVHRAVMGSRTNRWTLTWGLAVDNYTSLFEDKYYDSLLKLEHDRNGLINKWSAHIEAEIPLTSSRRDYFGITPRYVFQQQLNLVNQQVGVEANFRKAYTLGVFFNAGDFKNYRQDTRSLIFETTMRVLTTPTAQVRLGLHYMHNIGGLSQINGQTLQVSVSYVLRKDACKGTPDQRADCPAVSQSHRTLYENIWYKTGEGKKPGL